MDEIKGIEVSGEVYGLNDETARTNVKTNTTSIGTLDDLETEEKSNLVEAVNEVKSNVDEIETPTSLFDFLELLQGASNAATPLQDADGSEYNYTFNVENPTKYKGYAFVCGSCNNQASAPSNLPKERRIYFVLKDNNGLTTLFLNNYLGGDRGVQAYQWVSITNDGQATIRPGYKPREDSDSESDTSQDIFGVYAVYGIL